MQKYICAIFIFFVTNEFVTSSRISHENANYLRAISINELPSESDLGLYLDSFNKVMDGVKKVLTPSINEVLALVISNANLQKSLNKKGLPQELFRKLKETHSRSTEILKKIEYATVKDDRGRLFRDVSATEIFNSTLVPVWAQRMEPFRLPNAKRYKNSNIRFLQEKFSNIEDYSKAVANIYAHVPNPQLSDRCLLSLSELDQKTDDDNPQKCRVDEKCKQMVLKGDDFGYALTHRLLFLQTAWNSRGCNVFSREEDLAWRKKLCSIGYHEADFIANHLNHRQTGRIMDLLMEYIGLCSLNGDAMFLKRSWLTLVLTYQSPTGCFHDSNVYYDRIDRFGTMRLRSRDSILEMLNRNSSWCNGHATAVAITALTGAVRFIVETYY